MKTILIVGSTDPQGQTARAANAMREGVTKAGGAGETVFLPRLRIERCRQCNDDGWGTCRKEGRCSIKDQFSEVVQKIAEADNVVFATPVYYSDLSESLRAFTDRLRRTCTHEHGRKKVEGKAAVGLCVAGGGGGGAAACGASLDKVLSICGFEVVDTIPVRRQNLEAKLPQLRLAGEWLCRNHRAH